MLARLGPNRPTSPTLPPLPNVSAPADTFTGTPPAARLIAPQNAATQAAATAAASDGLPPKRSTFATIFIRSAEGIACGVAWVFSPVTRVYCRLATAILRYWGYKDAADLTAELQRSEEQIARRHESYLTEQPCETNWLPYGVNLLSRKCGLRGQEAYLYSYAGHLMIPDAATREVLLDKTQALRAKFTRYQHETILAFINAWHKSFESELERVRTGDLPAEEARDTLAEMDAVIDATRWSIETRRKPAFHARVQQVRHQLENNAVR